MDWSRLVVLYYYYFLYSDTMMKRLGLYLLLFFGCCLIAEHALTFSQQKPEELKHLFYTEWKAEFSSRCGEKKEMISAGIYQRLVFQPDHSYQILELGVAPKDGFWQYNTANRTLSLSNQYTQTTEHWQLIELDSAHMTLERTTTTGKCQQIFYNKVR